MYPLPLHPLQLFSVWILVSTLALFANPWWPFGWEAIVATTGPLILGLDRRIRREMVFAVGLPGIAWLCFLDPTYPIVPRLLVASAVFVVGVSLASRMLAERVSLIPAEANTFDGFKRTLEKEFGRARRHERGFAILSLAAEPRSHSTAVARGHAEGTLQESAGNREHIELAGLLASELHVYSDVVVARHRVLALVPELECAAAEALVKRVQFVIDRQLGFDVQIGVACFPSDAVCVDTLIAAADRDRTNPKLHSVPDRAADLDREVQG